MTALNELQETLSRYFAGLFEGNVDDLRSVFHPSAMLAGEVNGEIRFRALDEYLQIVANRRAPAELGESFRMTLVSLEVDGSIAVAKAHSPMLGCNYHDYLSLVRFEGR